MKTLSILLLTLSFCSYGQISREYSEVVFYGTPDYIYADLSQVKFKVKANDKKLFRLKVNRSKVAFIEPGLKTFSAKNLWKGTLQLDIKPNHKYLVEIKSTLFRPKLRLVSERKII
jgi:hypothetical protein